MAPSDERQVGRPAAVDRVEVVTAATTLLRDDGFSGLTMRRLGDTLGVDPMVAYRLFDSKDDLLDGVYHQVVLDSEPPASDDPITDVIAGFRNFRTELVENPGLVPVVTPRMLATKGAMIPFEWVMTRLVAAGFAPEAGLVWYTTLLSLTLGSASIHPAVQAREPRIDFDELDPNQYPTVATLNAPDHDALFDIAIDRLEADMRSELDSRSNS